MKKLVNREKIFKIILFLIPLLLFLLLELGLRLFSVFPHEPLFLEITKNGKEYFQLNPYVAKRYFKSSDKVIPTLYPETFEKNKSKSTFRIFALGGSTTAGFPFDYQVPFPQQLKFLLSEKYPENNIEVINLGLSAINSFSILDLIPEVLNKEPDLILIYMGHNEFYGVYGSASSYFIGENGNFIRFYLNLQKLQITQMMKSIIAVFTPAEKSMDKNVTLMERMIKEKKVEYNSDKYINTLNNFEDNLQIILESTNDTNTPIIVSNLVSNIKDLKPFSSKDEIAGNNKLRNLFNRNDSLFDKMSSINDFQKYIEILQHDSSSSYLYYRIGQKYLNDKDYKNAKYFYLKAKDRDYVRFRASEDLNDIIKHKTNQNKNYFLDMEKLFSASSSYEIVGNDLICDHLHPNPNGYYLMAKGFFQIITEMDLIKDQDNNFFPPQKPYFVTELDWDIGLLKIFKLKHRWPFENKRINYLDYDSYGNPRSGSIAYDYVFVHQNWVKAHENMAIYYAELKHFENERKEYEAIYNTFPEKHEFALKVAELLKKQFEWEKAERNYYPDL